MREARSASALNHPNIVTIYEIGEDAGRRSSRWSWSTARRSTGCSPSGPLPVPRALDYAVQIAVGAGRRARERHRPSRHQAGQHHGHARRPREGARLRSREADRAAPTDATITAVATEPGRCHGHAAYMSPEQAEGAAGRRAVRHLLVRRRPLRDARRPAAVRGSTHVGVITSILRDQPAPVRHCAARRAGRRRRHHRARAREGSGGAVSGCVRDAGGSRRGAREAHAAGRVRLATASGPRSGRRPAAGGGRLQRLAADASAARHSVSDAKRSRRSRSSSPPIVRSRPCGSPRASRYAPEEIGRIREAWFDLDIVTNPAGAEVTIRNYADLDGAWESLGTTPVRGPSSPRAVSRPDLEGRFLPMDVTYPTGTLTHQAGAERPASRAWSVRGRPVHRRRRGVRDAPGLLDRQVRGHQPRVQEVRRRRRIHRPEVLEEPLPDGIGACPFEEAMERFRDSTGRSGPATWELGSYPEGQEDFPVGGISWYEAAAYARFAGKELPTIYHWYRRPAGGRRLLRRPRQPLRWRGRRESASAECRRRGARSTWPATSRSGAPTSRRQPRRYILGGGWNEPTYRFRETEARDPWGRDALRRAPGQEGAAAPQRARTDRERERRSAESGACLRRAVRAVRGFYAYDRKPLDARVEASTNRRTGGKETVSFAAAYGGERIPAYLFLPKNVKPPYQTVVYFPNSHATEVRSSKYPRPHVVRLHRAQRAGGAVPGLLRDV